MFSKRVESANLAISYFKSLAVVFLKLSQLTTYFHYAYACTWFCFSKMALLAFSERIFGSFKRVSNLPNEYICCQFIDKKKERKLQSMNLYDFLRKGIQMKWEAKIHAFCILNHTESRDPPLQCFS